MQFVQEIPYQVPIAAAHFVGRELELARLNVQAGLALASVDSATPPIVVIAGAGGVGKTEIIFQWASRSAELFCDGTLYADLRGLSSYGTGISEKVLDGFLRSLGTPPERLPYHLHSQVALYRSLTARRSLLVIIDNADDVESVRPLIATSGRSLTVITSRSRLLGLVVREGAQLMTVDRLSLAEAVELLRSIIGSDRVDSEIETAREVVDLCDRLPLALRIVAAHFTTHVMDRLSDVAGQLRNEKTRLSLLSIPGDDSADVRVIFSWSYRALPPDVQRVFRLLSIHPGKNISLDAIEALCGMKIEAVRSAVSLLSDEHLIEGGDFGRYRMHDLLRSYAGELAEMEDSGTERDDAAGRLVYWYSLSLYNADQVFDPGDPDTNPVTRRPGIRGIDFTSADSAFNWMDDESANLVGIVELANKIEDHKSAIDIALNWWRYLNVTKRWSDWLECNRIAQKSAQAIGDLKGEGLVLTSTGTALRHLDRAQEAKRLHERALILFEEVKYQLGAAYASQNLANIHVDLEQFDQAIPNYLRSLELFQQLGEKQGEAMALSSLARAFQEMGRFAEAIEYAQQGLRVREGIGENESRNAGLLRTLGRAHAGLGRTDESLEYLQQALDINRRTNQRFDEAQTLVFIGDVRNSLGQVDQARALWQEAWTIYKKLEAPIADKVYEKLQNH